MVDLQVCAALLLALQVMSLKCQPEAQRQACFAEVAAAALRLVSLLLPLLLWLLLLLVLLLWWRQLLGLLSWLLICCYSCLPLLLLVIGCALIALSSGPALWCGPLVFEQQRQQQQFVVLWYVFSSTAT